MGWDFTMRKARPGEVMATFTQSWESNGIRHEVTDAKATAFGRHLWGIYRENGTPKAIALWLVEYRADSWGYKSLSEDGGPVYLDCPLGLLDKCPCPDSQYARDWRAKVRAQAGQRRGKPTPVVGETIRLTGCRMGSQSLEGHEATVERVVGRSAIVTVYGRKFTIPPKFMAQIAS